MPPSAQPRMRGTPGRASIRSANSWVAGTGIWWVWLDVARAVCGDVSRTKKPNSGARIGPCSRSDTRNEKLPDAVQRVMIVRDTSSGWAWYGHTLRQRDVPRYRALSRSPRRLLPRGCELQLLVKVMVVPVSPGSGRT